MSDLHELFGIPEDAMILTQSTINSLELSPCRVTTIPEGVRVEPSEAMFFGTVQHAGIEAFLKDELSHVALSAPAVWSKIAYEKADAEGIPLDKRLNDKHLDWMSEQAALFTAWYHDFYTPVGRHWPTQLVEEPLATPLGRFNGRDVFFATRGVDWLTGPVGENIGVDFKTSARGWWGNKGTAMNQDDAYTYLLYADSGHMVYDWRFVVGNRSKNAWDIYSTEVTAQSMNAFIKRVDGWAKFLTLDDIPHICTPLDSGTARGWWSRPDYNHAWNFCPTCRFVGDEYDTYGDYVENERWF